MLFKNAVIYEVLGGRPEIDSEKLEAMAFTPCAKHDPIRVGFVPPAPFDELVVTTPNSGLFLFCLQAEEKVLPPSVVRQAVEKKVAEIKQEEGRVVGRKERAEIKDELTFDMLGAAFSKTRRTHAIYDYVRGLLFVDGSANRADEVTTMLRQALGSLPVSPIINKTQARPAKAMAQWLSDAPPQGVAIGHYCKLQDPIEGGPTHTYRNDELSSEAVRASLNHGMTVSEISLEIDSTQFVIDSQLHLKSILFDSDALEEAAEASDGDPHFIARANILLVGRTLAGIAGALRGALGSNNEEQPDNG